MKKLAVIILNWNGRKLLQQFLPTAAKFTSGKEVDLIVADNGSSDDSIQWAKQHFPDLKYICFQENHGFAEGYNLAIKECRDYKYCCLLNSDVMVTEGWWLPILSFLENNPDVGAVQPKIKSFHNPELFEYAGAAGGMMDALCYPYCRGRLFDLVEKDHGQYENSVDIAWASGACLTVNTQLYLDLGGLDKDFFAHQEEIDLCIRIQAAGYRVCYIPDSEIFHVGGASLSADNPRKTYLNFRNNLLLIHKNSPSKKRFTRTFVRRLVDTAAYLQFIVKGDFKNARAVRTAHKDFAKMAKNYTSEPPRDIIPLLPGAGEYALLNRYLPWRAKNLKK